MWKDLKFLSSYKAVISILFSGWLFFVVSDFWFFERNLIEKKEQFLHQTLQVLQFSLKAGDQKNFRNQLNNLSQLYNFTGLLWNKNEVLWRSSKRELQISTMWPMLTFYKKQVSSLFLFPYSVVQNQPLKFMVQWDIRPEFLEHYQEVGRFLILYLCLSLCALWQLRKISRETSWMHQVVQASHDLCGPISALETVLHDFDFQRLEQKLILIKKTVERIRTIALTMLPLTEGPKELSRNNILSLRHKGFQAQPIFLPSLIKDLVEEKRLQFQKNKNLQIELVLQKSYDAFSWSEPVELTRALSNLMTNAVESLNKNHGNVFVSLFCRKDVVQISIADNGRGISQSIFHHLGVKMGVTYGKEKLMSGLGLGVYHAKKTIESMGGQFFISKTSPLGTSINITLKRAPLPHWFLPSLHVRQHQLTVCLYNGEAKENIWWKNFSAVWPHHLSVAPKFLSERTFKDWYNTVSTFQNCMFIVDENFVFQKMRGLDLISHLSLAGQSCLVTHRFQDSLLQNHAMRLNVGLVPSEFIDHLPIIVGTKENEEERPKKSERGG